MENLNTCETIVGINLFVDVYNKPSILYIWYLVTMLVELCFKEEE